MDESKTRFLTFDRLSEVLGVSRVEVRNRPAHGSIEITGPRIFDPEDPAAVGPGEVVLAVNLAADRIPALVGCAFDAGAAAIVARTSQLIGIETLAAGTGVLAADESVTWDHLYSVIRNAVNAAHETSPEKGDAPLGDLFALANAMAASVGGAVTIEDPRSNLLAHSNLEQPIDEARQGTILGRRTPNRWAVRLDEEGIMRQLRSRPARIVQIRDSRGETRDRLATGVWAGNELLGFVWVVEGDQPLDESSVSRLEESAPLIALHLLRHRSSEDLTRRERAGLLDTLLDGRGSVPELAAAMHLDPGASCAVVVFHIAVDDPAELSVKRSRAMDLIVLACESFRRQVVCAPRGQTVCALFPGMTWSTTATLKSLVADIASRTVDSLGVRTNAGIGPIASSLEGARFSRTEAERALRVLLNGHTNGPVAEIGEVRVSSTLLEVGDFLRSHPELRPAGLDLMQQRDAKSGKGQIETMRTVCETAWDIPAAATRLHLHANTLRYRIRRFEEITGMSLDDARNRVLLSLYLLTVGAESTTSEDH